MASGQSFALPWQGDPTIIPIKAAPDDDNHVWLAFSFPTLQTTSVMSIAGTHFHEAVLPGIQQQAASLLLTSMPGGWLVQVTAQVSAAVVANCWLVQLCDTCFGTCSSCQTLSTFGGGVGQLLSAPWLPSASAAAAVCKVWVVQAAALASPCQTCLVSRAPAYAALNLTGSWSKQRS